MDDRHQEDAALEREDQIEDLEVEAHDAENVKGGKKSLDAERQGTEHQHNETLLRS